jgi:hypothetical protein
LILKGNFQYLLTGNATRTIMKPTPEQIATRLLGHADEYSMFTTQKVRALIIRAVEEERARQEAQPGGGPEVDGLEAGI